MGLDVYVGSLTRYYCNEWETVQQLSKRARGGEHAVERFSPAIREALSRDLAREHILAWRNNLNDVVGAATQVEFDWDESPEAPYFTDKPLWAGYGDLLLWAAYEEHPDLLRPDHSLTSYADDPAFCRSTDGSFETRYPHLLSLTEWWLPTAFDFVFRAEDPAGVATVFGSTAGLERDLRRLNARTWRAGKDDVQAWWSRGPRPDAGLEDSARFGFAVFLRLARKATHARLVMKLDY